MGGDAHTLVSSLNFSPEEEVLLLEQNDFSELSSQASAASLRDLPIQKEEDGNAGEQGVVFGISDDDLTQQISTKSTDFVYETRRKNHIYRRVLDCYDKKQHKLDHLEVAKANILRYRPGSWIEHASKMKLSDVNVPGTTTLLLIGPKGSGKSSLVNRISRVLDGDKFACDRAQVSYNYSAGGGTYFLQEYMIPRGSSSFCLYDTRSLSEDSSENMVMLKHWMTKGVRHGELVVRDSDSSILKTAMKSKARHSGYCNSMTRPVNFVIFVVSGLSILRSVEGDNAAKSDSRRVLTTFNYPFLSFRDDKPVVVVTHGDLLSPMVRAKIRFYLGELLDIPPTTQIFDIPENYDQVTELEIVSMLRYCLEHADRNLDKKEFSPSKVMPIRDTSIWLLVLFLLFVVLAVILYFNWKDDMSTWKCTCEHQDPSSTPSDLDSILDWPSIRHLWLGDD